MDDYILSRRDYTYDEIAKAKAVADEKIDSILEPILEHFDKETKRIVNKLCVSYSFNNEEEKAKLIENFQKAIKEKIILRWIMKLTVSSLMYTIIYLN